MFVHMYEHTCWNNHGAELHLGREATHRRWGREASWEALIPLGNRAISTLSSALHLHFKRLVREHVFGLVVNLPVKTFLSLSESLGSNPSSDPDVSFLLPRP